MIVTKKGRTAKINGLGIFKSNYGTVDYIDFKSVYITLQCWMEPVRDYENWNRIIGLLSKDIRNAISGHINGDIFEDRFICDLDLRASGIRPGKRSFFNLEINLFIKNKDIQFKSDILRLEILKINKAILYDSLLKNEWFQCFPTKKK
jgi:hypothetical protein